MGVRIIKVASAVGVVPIGSIIAWLKSFTNTPALPSGFVECDGSVLNDSDSVYDGQTIPDLNGDNRFLRGNATSEGTGGAASVNAELDNLGTMTTDPSVTGILTKNTFNQTFNMQSIGTGKVSPYLQYTITGIPTVPPYYNVVWIMRIK